MSFLNVFCTLFLFTIIIAVFSSQIPRSHAVINYNYIIKIHTDRRIYILSEPRQRAYTLLYNIVLLQSDDQQIVKSANPDDRFAAVRGQRKQILR